ncbi:MAG TPA: hypothetical protein VMG12_27005 [Polyangiaceae bacterium]|nr:hypothetical protein [Polyangiaceae bacterium]
MNQDVKKAVAKSRAAVQQAHPRERAAFKSLLLANPNHFGNLVESPFPSVLGVAGNTHYEELACVGYHPQQERLEGVVYVYQTSGYGGGPCGPGTPEYVRFYLSFDNGVTWQDQGMTSFRAYDIPEGTEGAKRLEYAVSLAIDPKQKSCLVEQLIQVRAILSWNNPPPDNQPNWTPIFGNVVEATIQVEARHLLFLPELFDLAKLKLPPHVVELVHPSATLAVQATSLAAGQLAALYKGKGMPAHRIAFKELKAYLSSQLPLSAESLSSIVPGVAIEPSLVELLTPKADGDISFEELTCIGLDPNSPDTLVGIVRVKKSAGYSGGLCSKGSQEFVTFWADFDGNGSFETCLGTAVVTVHDLATIPAGGVHYAVRLPVDLDRYRGSCQEPRVVKIRAILSWEAPAPCFDPNHIPTWGNREETLIHIAPRAVVGSGRIAILGGIPVSGIDGLGLTTPSAVFATNNIPPDSLGRPCPFAGVVTVQGSPVNGQHYVVDVSPDGALWTPVLNDLIVTDQLGVTSTHKADPASRRFAYLPFEQNVNGLLARWSSNGDALWFVRLSVYDSGGTLQGVDVHRIQLDNTAPEASIEITSGAGDCGKFAPGAVLSGRFVARDTYLARYSIGVEPAVNPAGVGVVIPSSGWVNTAPAPGDTWTLDTTGMQPCGYVIRVVASDRAIVNSQSVGLSNADSSGFCLLDPAGG